MIRTHRLKRMAELLRMRWEESDLRFGTVKRYSSKTKKWRTIKAPSAATLIARRKTIGHGGAIHASVGRPGGKRLNPTCQGSLTSTLAPTTTQKEAI